MPNSSPRPVVGIDLGGTSVKAALVSPELEILAHDTRPTDVSDEAHLLNEIERLVGAVADGNTFAAVGFGLPSQIDQRHGRVADSINVPITDIPFVREMTRRLDVPVRIDNDANVACLAEARIGAGKGRRHVIMLTLGTGVGGGMVLDGDLYHGATGYGGELGHMTIDEDGPPCQGHCPNRGCLEILASAAGVRAAALEVVGEALEARAVIDRAEAGDAACIAALEVVGRHLGVGIANYVNIFNPDVVVIGGGLIAAGELLLGPAREEAGRRALRPPWREVEVVAAELGNDAGVLGAAALVL
ncbi:MAG TPA: ROK family protein [Gaiellales bacterium]|nr:ROK family protein [Gaiellales bacterium]